MDSLNIVSLIIWSFVLLYSLGMICTNNNYHVHGTTISSCNQTPYPDVCHYFSNTKSINSLQDNKFQSKPFSLRDQSISVTMNLALEAQKMISSLDLVSFDQKTESAWNDCVLFHEDTIDLLSRSSLASNHIDAQTWLSASIANQQTCQNGFDDFKLPSNVFESSLSNNMFSNLSKLISNSLALNNPISSSHSSFSKQIRRDNRKLLGTNVDDHDTGFPTWISVADRKLLQSSSPKLVDVVVAQDESGDYKTIMAAVEASVGLRGGSSERFVIYIKKGVYKENVEIKKTIKNIMFVGDGIDATIVSGNKNAAGGTTTFRTATCGISGDGFIAKDMTFENTAGAEKHQAVALRSSSDYSVFYGCSFKGYQDTLYVYSQRQFYRNCDIHGTQDFIFGDAVVVLQGCNIIVRKPLSYQSNTITAQGRTDPNENTGIVIHNCRVVSAGDLASIKSYLGRPWQKYSRTLFLKNEIGGFIHPQGWLPWSGNSFFSTLFYGEYSNTGAGSATGGRVKWPGFHVLTSASEAGKFTVGNFLAGGSWIPSTGVPFEAGL